MCWCVLVLVLRSNLYERKVKENHSYVNLCGGEVVVECFAERRDLNNKQHPRAHVKGSRFGMCEYGGYDERVI